MRTEHRSRMRLVAGVAPRGAAATRPRESASLAQMPEGRDARRHDAPTRSLDEVGAEPGADATTTRTVDGPARHEHEVQRFWLVVTQGPDAGATFTSAGERAVIGTHESADLVLKDETVSRFHCEIDRSGGAAVARDLGSRNGTAIDGVAVVAGYLREGSTLLVGRTELRFELRSEPVKVPLSEQDHFDAMVGRSVAMRRVFALLERAAASDATVLLEGETGTGKEVAAESIHRMSARREGPFVVVDCASIPPDLLQTELFGHEKGAFTGAAAAREGAFEVANGGTIFLDEIGELSLDLQPKLLRALERRQVKRVGGNRYVPVDVRIVAATNRSLRTEVNERRFRSDLYYRLAVVEVRLPPLRARPEDLPLLVERILEGLGAADRPEAAPLVTAEFVSVLARHRWSGNVRELRNYIERCLALREQPPLGAAPEDDAGGGARPAFDQPLRIARERWTRHFERRYVEELLQRSDGKVAIAARAAGVDRMYFYRLLWRYGLK
jgi:two-component system, NtrC family, response regulator GlrR